MTLYLTFGPTHSGKTTFGKKLYNKLVRSTKTIHIDNDEIEYFIRDNFNNLRTDPDIVSTRTPTNPDLRLRIPQLIADYALEENYNVIITASHSRALIRKSYYDIAKKHHADVMLLIFQTSENEIAKRIKHSERKTDFMLNVASFEDLIIKQKTILETPTPTEKGMCSKVFYIDETNTEEVLYKIVEE